MQKSPRTAWIVLPLIVFGVAASLVLLLRALALLEGEAAGGLDVCSIVFEGDCDEALSGEASRWFGVPLGGWGLVFYGTLACLLLTASALGDAFGREGKLAALVLGAVGACVSVILLASIILGISPLCPLCILVHVVNLALVWALWRHHGRALGEVVADMRGAVRYAFGQAPGASPEARWKAVGLVLAGLFAVLIFQWALGETRVRRAAGAAPTSEAHLIESYESAPPVEIPVRGDDPRLGPADAPARLVVFTSLQCPACRNFAEVLRRLVQRHPQTLTVVFKHYPLGAACNPETKRDLHPLACEAAAAAEAARLQGRFWTYHDALFQVRLKSGGDAFDRLAEVRGFDKAQFASDRAKPEAAARVAEDIALGRSLRIRATPAVFLNGRRVALFTEPNLDVLIRHVAESAGR